MDRGDAIAVNVGSGGVGDIGDTGDDGSASGREVDRGRVGMRGLAIALLDRDTAGTETEEASRLLSVGTCLDGFGGVGLSLFSTSVPAAV